MTKTICPTCGARCKAKVVHDVILKTHQIALPQPDLTKLREIYKNHNSREHLEFLRLAHDPYFQKIWQTVKEILNAETSDSEDSN